MVTPITPRLSLPLMSTAQRQKEAVYNELAIRLDAMTMAHALTKTLTAPPATPNNGDCYIIPAGATGVWAGKTDQIAQWYSGWIYYTPSIGWLFFVDDQLLLFVYEGVGGGGWTSISLDTTALLRKTLNLSDVAAPATALANIGGLAKAGGSMTGPLALAADPTTALQAATKQYVDNVATGFSVKPAVLVATTAQTTLSGLSVVDGVTLVAGNRVLVRAQTSTPENGIYVAAAGAWTRALDMGVWAEVPGTMVLVEAGSTEIDTGWVCTATVNGTIGTTAITWSQFFGTGLFQAASSNLAAIAALVSAADKLAYFTGSGTVSLTALTAFARTVLGAADAATARAALGIAAAGGDAAYLQVANNLSDLTNLPNARASLGVAYKYFGGGYESPILASEVITRFTLPLACTVGANLAGWVGSLTVNPAASFVLNVAKNGTAIGTITVSTAGVFTFASTGGAAVTFAVGDQLTITAPSSADASIAGLSITMRVSY